MITKELQVQMFGGFTIYYGKEPVLLNKLENSKAVRLLQMLLLSGSAGISKSELLDHLYGFNEKPDMANRNKNLNNLIYRLRGQLASCGLPDTEYVVSREGIYFFNSEIPLKLDTDLFEKKIEAARGISGGLERTKLLTEAEGIYLGELLPGNLSNAWFYQRSRHYKDLYLEAVGMLEEEFVQKGDFMKRLQLYQKAAAIYPFDNWQTKLIRCNLEAYRYEEAMQIYQETVELYAREMGTPPTEEMQECFEMIELQDASHQVGPGGQYSWRSMDKVFRSKGKSIWDSIMESCAHGAYYCTYPSFADYCKMVARAKDRNQFNAVLMFLTLSGREKKGKPEQIDLPVQMDLLKSVIGDSLRVGDAYTRYGNRHFILMLMNTETEFCSTIFLRIEKAYQKKSGKGELWYYADMTQELNREPE